MGTMTDVAHRRWWQVFEVVVGLPLAAAVVLQHLRPLSLPQGALSPLARPVAVVAVVAGGWLIVAARRQFAHQGQPTDPGHPTTRLVTTGVFAVSRNPLYVGGFLLLAGLALLVDAPWMLILLVPGVAACAQLLIRPEERYLAARFQAEYLAYEKKVCRWLGRAST